MTAWSLTKYSKSVDSDSRPSTATVDRDRGGVRVRAANADGQTRERPIPSNGACHASYFSSAALPIHVLLQEKSSLATLGGLRRGRETRSPTGSPWIAPHSFSRNDTDTGRAAGGKKLCTARPDSRYWALSGLRVGVRFSIRYRRGHQTRSRSLKPPSEGQKRKAGGPVQIFEIMSVDEFDRPDHSG